MTTATSIPVVDLADLDATEAAARDRATHAIREGFGTYGLVYVRHHGVDPAVLDAFYQAFLALTQWPDERKRALGRADLWFQRGWTPPHTETAVLAGGQPDFKECYFAAPIALDPHQRDVHPEIHADNVWPEDGDRLRPPYLTLGAQLHAAGERLLLGCARALDLPDATFTSLTAGGPHVTRALRYLPLDAQQVGTKILWGEEHTDFNLLTLLPGGTFLDRDAQPCARPDDASGLHLRTRNGQRVPGTAPAGCIVAQVGQQLEILSGGTFLATPHVITAPRTPGYSRLSAAHFVHAHTAAVLQPLDGYRTPEALAKYGHGVTAGIHDLRVLVEIGLAPRAALDRLQR